MSRTLPARILVLGATSAIAMAVCRELISPDSRFFLVARRADRLDAVRNDLLTRGACSVITRAINLDDVDAHAHVLSEAAAELGSIDLALLAYGILGDQEQAQSDFAASYAILHTHFISAASLITWLANYFENAGKGTLAVISSVAGDRGRKSNYVYGTSKGALNIFLDGVRNRIDRSGANVLTIRPGFVSTPMTAHLRQGPLFASPAKIAKGIVGAISAKKDVVYLPGFWRPIMFFIRALPEFLFKKLNL
jgi:decaprenylphospho-beta-D-erythro-pentofuranosid-2-ulose 2-reductase